MLVRRFLVFLFILLQGLSPLLHAHAGGIDHGGIHLPQNNGLSCPDAPTLHSHAMDESVAFTVDASLQARDPISIPAPLPLPSLAHIAFHWAPPVHQENLPHARLTPPSPGPLLAAHRIPHPCAPPRI